MLFRRQVRSSTSVEPSPSWRGAELNVTDDQTGSGVLLSDVQLAEQIARRGWSYEFDEPNRDTWRSEATECLQAHQNQEVHRWKGDCDDLGSTVLDLACRFGVAPEQLYRAMVSSPQARGDQIDHYVGLYEQDGEWWVIGDTFESRPTPLRRSSHKIIRTACVAEGLLWREWNNG